MCVTLVQELQLLCCRQLLPVAPCAAVCWLKGVVQQRACKAQAEVGNQSLSSRSDANSDDGGE
jgi:hypothetical protein